MRRATAALVVIAACGRSASPSSPPPPTVAGDAGGVSVSARAPVPGLPDLPHTQAPDVAMAELAAGVLGLSRQATSRTDALPELVGELLTHASVTGRLDDYVAADAASARWVELADGRAQAHLLRAKVDATLHRFDDAAHELDVARTLGATAEEVADRRIDLDLATGRRLDDAVAARKHDAEIGPNVVTLTMLALALDERGDAKAALALMPKALATVRDPSAIPFAWLLFQWARLAEDTDDLVLARALYEEAHRRLPRYGEAGRHLAALMIRAGDDARAKALLDALDAADPHPETTAMRAELAARTGAPDARALLDAARAGWERYLAALPAAFGDHAARFYLGVGADPHRALTLALANLANRPTAEAHALAIEAALAAGDPTRACDLAARLVALGAAPRRHRFTAWKAFTACNRAADADALARELGIAGGAAP